MGNPSIRGVKTPLVAFLAIALVLSASFLMPVQQAWAAGPSHTTIQSTINLAQGYINSLYKDVNIYEVGSSTHAVLAEYPSLPIWLEMSDGRKIAVGEDVNIKNNIKTSQIDGYNEYASDGIEYYVRFRTVDAFGVVYDKVPRLYVNVDYNYGTGQNIRIVFNHVAWDSNPQVSWVDLYFGSDYIGRLGAGSVGNSYVWTSVNGQNNDIFFRSHRYIERHGTQLGVMWYDTYDSSKRAELANRLSAEGYTVYKDIYAPLFGKATSQGNNYLYESGSSGVYRDCYTEPAKRERSYQYHSKVCTLGVDTYIAFSRSSDWLVPTLWAIHLLNKGVNPDTPVYDGWQTWSPRQVARFVESKWIADYGIKSPSSSTVASGVRTAAFLVLETKLGYGPANDSTSRTYADKAASALVNPQQKTNILVRENEDGSLSSFTRPLTKGGIYTAWNGFNIVAKKSILQQIGDLFNQPDETPDIKPSNAETTITVAQALRVYDCYVYGSNCANTP